MALFNPNIQLREIYDIANNRQVKKFYCMLKSCTVDDNLPTTNI